MDAAILSEKLCTKCHVRKPLVGFNKMSSSKDGRAWQCKGCGAAQNALWRTSNADKLKINKAAYHAANKAHFNAKSAKWHLDNKERHDEYGAAYRAANREKAKARSVEWRLANVGRSRSTVAAWRKANPEKVKLIGAAFLAANPDAKKVYHANRRDRAVGRLSVGLTGKLLKLQRGLCACCSEALGDDFHLDHIMPLALGGLNEDANMQLLRATCNMRKSAKDPIDYMQSKGFLI